MSTSGVIWTASPALLSAKVARLGAAFTGAVDTLARATALEAERYAKEGAPWQNITGLARASLAGTSSVSGASGEVVLAHGVDYGIWLELANGRAFGILPEALDHAVGYLDTGLNGLLDNVARGLA